MAEQQSFDLAVVGGGPGGYVAAIRAAQLGMKAVVIEREALGGICLNWGCIPTKALLRSSELYHLMHRAEEFGLSTGEVGFDLDAVVKRSRGVAGQLSKGVAHLLKKNKVTVIEGEATLSDAGKLALKAGGEVKAPRIVMATGARARQFDHLKADGKKIWTYRHALEPDVMPKSLLVIGSGAIGMEFASFFATLGSEVTVVEALPRILPNEDEEISKFAAKSFKKQGLNLLADTQVTSLQVDGDGVAATLKDAKGNETQHSFHRAILAVGIVGNVDELGLEEAGMKVERGHVVVNEYGETGVKGVSAIGDMAGPPWLAHKASHEGVVAVERLAGHEGAHPMDLTNIPACTYCQPQIASVGMTEQAAKDAGKKVRIGRFPFQGNGKALALGEPDGMVKTIFDDKTGALLGAHMIGAEVTELIQGFAIARKLETTEEDLMQTVFPHPTLSEMMHESVLDAYGRTIHF